MDESSFRQASGATDTAPPTGLAAPPSVRLSMPFTTIMALVLVSGIAFFIWLQISVPPLDRVGFPERALSLLVGQTLDVEEAIAHAPSWERRLYQLTTESGSNDLRQAISWYRELSGVTFNPDIHLQRVILEAEAGDRNEVRQEVHDWLDREPPFPLYARFVQAAYFDEQLEESTAVRLQAELADTLPTGWFYSKLALHLAERSHDSARVNAVRTETALRVAPLLKNIRLLTAVELGMIALGLIFFALIVRSARKSFTVAMAPLPPVWRGRIGAAVLIRGAALGLLLSLAVLLWETSDLLVRLLSIPLAGFPLVALTRQYLLAPHHLGFVSAFGLRPVKQGWSRLVMAGLAVLAIGLIGEWGLGEVADRWNLSSHWTEWFDADLAWGSLPVMIVSLIEFTVLAPLFEEFAFRGVLFGTLRRKFAWWPSAAISAGIFAGAHGYGALGFISVFVSGLLWAWIYEKTGSLLPGMIAHAANNLLVCLSIIYLVRV